MGDHGAPVSEISDTADHFPLAPSLRAAGSPHLVLSAQICLGDPLFRAVPGDAPAAGERLLGRPRIPTLAERSPRHIWVESTRCGEPATRNEGAKGQSSTPSEISLGVPHGPPYVLYGDDLGEAKIQGVVLYLSTDSD